MKVRELTVTNFRGFAGERRFQLSDRFTVIAGINGRGKSSLLRWSGATACTSSSRAFAECQQRADDLCERRARRPGGSRAGDAGVLRRHPRELRRRVQS